MIEINAVCLLVVITTHPEARQTFVTEGLFYITGCVKSHLIAGIQHEVVDNLII